MELITGLFTLIAMLFGFVIWLIPMVLIAVSDKTDGREKLAWILACIFITWFAWIFYLLLAPIKPRLSYRH